MHISELSRSAPSFTRCQVPDNHPQTVGQPLLVPRLKCKIQPVDAICYFIERMAHLGGPTCVNQASQSLSSLIDDQVYP